MQATFCVGVSPLTEPILNGDVSPKGIALEQRTFKSMDDNSRRMLNVEFDIAEMSIATYTKAREQGVPITALPLFTSGRRFMHTGIQLGRQSGIEHLSQLRGRTVGAGQYWVSSSIWQRQILRQLYGVAEDQFAWVTLNPERMEELRIPDGVKQRRDASGRSMRDLAAAGEIDASLAAGAANPPGQPDPLIPAFPDREQAMRDYYGQTGIFPIVHITVLKRELVEREPWISESLVEAYLQAKRVAESRLASESAPAGEADDNPEDTVRALGGDPWAYGIGPNRKALEAFVATAHDQGLVGRRFTVDELFVPNLSEELS